MFIVLVLMLNSLTWADKNVTCEKIVKNHKWQSWNRQNDICFLMQVVIDEPNFTVDSPLNVDVGGISIHDNKAVTYLPIDIYESFPEVIRYVASSCRIQAVFKENFKMLKKLSLLTLSSNQIEMIPSNIFDDLVSLELLFLSKVFYVFLCLWFLIFNFFR